MFLQHSYGTKPQNNKKGGNLSPLHTGSWASAAVQDWNTAASWNESWSSKGLSAETLTSWSNVWKTLALLKTTIKARNDISETGS